MREYKVYIKVCTTEENKKYIACVCLRDNKNCNSDICIKDTMLYDEYKGWQECFKNKHLHK